MEDMVDRVSVVLKEVAAKHGLSLAEDKEERLIFRDGGGRRGKRGICEKVKWLGLILDEDLDFGPHWETRIAKARNLLSALDGMGTSKCGMSPLSWRQAYTGMIRSVASWRVEVGWRCQREWREEMGSLQYAALRKCTRAVLGSQKTLVRGVAAVEDVETFASAAAGRFLARRMCNPVRAGVAMADDPVLEGKGALSLGGPCWHRVVEVVDLRLGGDASVGDWEAAIERARDGVALLFRDGSRDESGRVGGGWWGSRGGCGSVALGTVATVWDGEIPGMRLALESIAVASVLVLSDSQSVIASIRNAAARGSARSADLRAVVDMVGEWTCARVPIRFAWVKAHVGVGGNELADEMAKEGCTRIDVPSVTGRCSGPLEEGEGCGADGSWLWGRAGGLVG